MNAKRIGSLDVCDISELLEGKRVLCVASSSSYQLFTLLSIFGNEANSVFERCDLLLPSTMPDVNLRKEEALAARAFDNVFILEMDYEKAEHPLRSYLIQSGFHARRYRDEFLNRIAVPYTFGYDIFLYPGYVPIAIDSKAYLAPSARSYIYDEGTGTYNGLEYETCLCGDSVSKGIFSSDGINVRGLRKGLSRLLVGKRARLDPQGQLVFRADLLPDWLAQRLRPYKIDIPESGDVYHSLMPNGLDLGVLERARVVFLTLSDDGTQAVLRMEEELISWLHDRLGDALVVKPHPGRSDLSPLVNASCRILPRSTPWEAVIAGGLLPDNCFLAGICSSAQMTPNTVFGFEPKLLFLANLIDLPASTYEAVGATIGMMRGAYERKDRIAVPDSLEELNDVLER